jgi:hypothetical protein
MRTMKVEFEVPIGEGLNALMGVGPKVTVSTEVVLSDDTEEAAHQAGREANDQVTAFIAGWGEGG